MSTPRFSPPGPDLSISSAASILGTSTYTVRKLLSAGELQAYELRPGAVRIRRESVIALRNRVLPLSHFNGAAA